MAQQTIDIGAAPNDGTGDPIRDAFDKCNDNFTELYAGLTGLLDFKGTTDCSANPNYPAAAKGDCYLVSVAGKIGGGSGVTVEAGDLYFATADNAGGTQAGVGSSWTVVQGNIISASGGVNVEDEGASVVVGATTINFTGPGVTATNSGGGVVEVAVPGGGFSGGVQSTPILAAAMTARTTGGAATGSTETTTNKIMLATLDFDQSADEFAQFMFPMPKSWNESTVTAQFIWTATATGNVVWGIQGVAISDDDVLDAAFGAAVTVTDSVTAANDLMQSPFTSAVTIGDSPAEGDLVCFQVYRDADNGSDTLAADAKLIGIRLNFTTNAADDS